eukprot:tig00020902_g14958.t1
MSEERTILNQLVFSRLRSLCAAKGLLFCPIDLRWGLTEEDSAGGRVLLICLSEIDRSRPYFISFLGERYGWHIPEGGRDPLLERTFESAMERFPWLSEYRDRSVTEAEVLHGALVNGGGLEGQTFFYFRDPSASSSYPSESEHAGRRLEDLKGRIRSSGFRVREGYPSAAEAAKWALEDLTAAIERDFQGGSRTPEQLDDDAHSAFAGMHERSYVPKLVQVRELEDFLTGRESTPICVTGIGGKSALLANFARGVRWRAKELGYVGTVVIEHYVEAGGEAGRVPHLLKRLMRRLAEAYGTEQRQPPAGAPPPANQASENSILISIKLKSSLF